MGDIGGEEVGVEMDNAPAADNGEAVPAMESVSKTKGSLLTENEIVSLYLKNIKNKNKHKENIVELKKADIYNKNFFINEELNKLICELVSYTNQMEDSELEDVINEETE
jgi:hypothetical protein